jgi:hypothetical protein
LDIFLKTGLPNLATFNTAIFNLYAYMWYL